MREIILKNFTFITILISTVFILSLPVSGTYTYSIIHLSDLQNLASKYPETYEYIFSYLDSIQDDYNISAIILTGDIVNFYNSKKEWEVYSQSIAKTDIPVYVIAGNHDTNYGSEYKYFFHFTGNDDDFYITTINDFNLVGIDFPIKTRSDNTFKKISNALKQSPYKFNIIATHFYMDSNFDRSILGNDIFKKLIDRPTIIMAGHVHTHVFRVTNKDGKYPVIEDIANYQDGNKITESNQNIAAGTFYTVSANKGVIEKIITEEIFIFPEQKFGTKQIVYQQ